MQELLSPEREKTTMTTIIQDIGDKAEDEQGNHVEELSSGELFDEEMFVDEIELASLKIILITPIVIINIFLFFIIISIYTPLQS